MKLTLIALLVIATVASAQDYPYPPEWNPNASDEADRTCASKYRGRKFTCTIETESNPGQHFQVVIWTDRPALAERPSNHDLTIPVWGMTCSCAPKGPGYRSSRKDFVCWSNDGGAFVGKRLSHSDMNGYGQGAPFGGQWRATFCDDFNY